MMMNKSTLEILLNQFYNCSNAIKEAIEKDDSEELDALIKKKKEIIKTIELNKKFIESAEFSLFDCMIAKIKEQELENLKLLKVQRGNVYRNYLRNVRTSKVLNKYSQMEPRKGNIVDMKE